MEGGASEGGCGGWSAVPFFCLKPDFFRNCRLNFKVSPDHPMAHLLFVSCVYVSFVLSRVGLGQLFQWWQFAKGGATFGAERSF